MINILKNNIVLIITVLVGYGCSSITCEKSTEDDSFAFFFENTFTANRINSFNHEVTTDWWMEDSTTINLCFTSEELNSIREEMLQIDILHYPNEYKPVSGGDREFWINPHPVYFLKIRINGIIKVIHWNNSNLSQIEDAKKLIKLCDYIQNILDKKPEFRQIHRMRRTLI